jgi:hypothetical protein
LESMTLKMRIAVLWIFMAVAMSAHVVLSVFEPGVIEQIVSGKMWIGEEMFLFMSLFWLIPLTMAYLSVTLKAPTNRRTNITLGVVFTVLNVFHLLFELIVQPSIHMVQWSLHQLLIDGSTVVVTSIIVWHAWKWPKDP